MAYIGRQSGNIGNYVRCNTITPDGSTTTFALTNVLDNTAIAPGTENNVICSVSGVIQAPGTAFNIDGTNIVFSAAPLSTDVVDFVLVLGETVSIGTPSDGSVTTAKISGTLANSVLTGSGAITINGSSVALGGSTTISTIDRPTITSSSIVIEPSTGTTFTLTGTNFRISS